MCYRCWMGSMWKVTVLLGVLVVGFLLGGVLSEAIGWIPTDTILTQSLYGGSVTMWVGLVVAVFSGLHLLTNFLTELMK